MKEKILDKATEMFLSFGFKSVTMDDLAQELGISKKTIYAHFNNKTKLIEACTMQVYGAITLGIDTICALNKDPISELYEIKKFVMIHLKNEQSSPQYQLQKYYPKIYDTIRQKQFEHVQNCIVENMERGIAQGIYRKNLDLKFASRIYFSGITSIKDQSLFPNDLFPMPDLMDNYLEYHVRGIINKEGRKILNKLIDTNID
ncbi:TetR/AcrR family transcriptional regulator [Arenibacter nanhaiticus]|nr:TetR/AcrR family transcriptional regulator [Arenibacter nanhaiticus]